MENDAQVLIYTSYLHIIGGIETFILNLIDLLHEDYDIGVVCPKLPEEMAEQIRAKAKLFSNTRILNCDHLIMVRKMDSKPSFINYKNSVRMCHACKSDPSSRILKDCDHLVHVSNASKESFKSEGEVILNPLFHSEKKSLLLVSATRIPALDKGQNAERMLRLAQILNDHDIPFLWLNFSDAPLRNAPKGFVNVGHFAELQPYIARADYLVQLSDREGFGYSVLEALLCGTAVLCTPFETTKELGVIDGKNGYIIPFDLDFDPKILYNVPVFEFTWNNDKLRKQWKKILKVPKRKPAARPADMVEVLCTGEYYDIELKRVIKRGENVSMPKLRAMAVNQAGYCKIL